MKPWVKAPPCNCCQFKGHLSQPDRRYMAEILLIRRKTLSNQSINQQSARTYPYHWQWRGAQQLSMTTSFKNIGAMQRNWTTPWTLHLMTSIRACVELVKENTYLIWKVFKSGGNFGNYFRSAMIFKKWLELYLFVYISNPWSA